MKNLSTSAVIQICLGTLLILGGVWFAVSENFLLSIESVFIGLGLLLYGFTNNTKDKSASGKILTYIGTTFYIIGLALAVYNTFFI